MDRRPARDEALGGSAEGDVGDGPTGPPDEPAPVPPFVAAVFAEWWVDKITFNDEGSRVEVRSSVAPDLRAVYEAIERHGSTEGTVTVDGPSAAWAIDHVDHQVQDVRRVGGRYTVHRLSALEQVALGVAGVGVYVVLAALVTAAASLFLTTPLALFDVGTLPGVLWGLGLGVALMVAGLVAFVAAPGLTHGAVEAVPGVAIERFEDLPVTDRAALIAADDAKSERNLNSLVQTQGALALLGRFGFAAYLGVIGWLNAGAVGVLVVLGLFALWILAQVGSTLALLKTLDPLEDAYVTELLEEVREAGDVTVSPTLYGYGDPHAPIHGSVAVALPEQDAILVPWADVEKLRRDELQATLAHELEHVRSHRPVGLALAKALLLLVPGLALLASAATPSPLQVGLGLFFYFGLLNAALAFVQRRWEHQADAFASRVVSPLAMAYALTRLTDRHVVDAEGVSILSGPGGELYGSHPYPHRRVARLIQAATELDSDPPGPGGETA